MTAPKRFSDTSGIACPVCHGCKAIRFTTIPESTTRYTLQGETHAINNGTGRDYSCGHCGAEWSMYGQHEDDDNGGAV